MAGWPSVIAINLDGRPTADNGMRWDDRCPTASRACPGFPMTSPCRRQGTCATRKTCSMRGWLSTPTRYWKQPGRVPPRVNGLCGRAWRSLPSVSPIFSAAICAARSWSCDVRQDASARAGKRRMESTWTAWCSAPKRWPMTLNSAPRSRRADCGRRYWPSRGPACPRNLRRHCRHIDARRAGLLCRSCSARSESAYPRR